MSTWMDMVQPLVQRFEVAAKFDQQAVHNAQGSDAIAKLMKAMAGRLDYVVEHYELKPGHDPYPGDD